MRLLVREAPQQEKTGIAPAMQAAKICMDGHMSIEQLTARAGWALCTKTILSVLKNQFGWDSKKQVRLDQAILVLYPWRNPADASEPIIRTVQARMMKASMLEWVCFMGTNSARAHRILESADIALFGKDCIILISKNQRGEVSMMPISAIDSNHKRHVYYACTCLWTK